MLIKTLKSLFKRDLEKLIKEIAAYQSEEAIWLVDHNITNTAGNLCLHLVGNLNTFIGAVFGKTGYIRQRELEFSLKNVARAELIKQVEETILIVDAALDQVTAEQLESDFPMVVSEHKTSTELMLVHLATHLTYHLGQINYHRRLLDTSKSS